MKVKVKSIAHDRIYSESKHPEITIGKEYIVLTIEDDGDRYRILNDNNEPIIYEKEIFEVIDDRIPKNWIKEYDRFGVYSIYPTELSTNKYFFEEYFDGHQQVIDAFNAYIEKLDMT